MTGKMKSILIKGGRIVDPANAIDRVADILTADGRIAKIGNNISAGGAEIIEAKGRVVIPGLVDMHVHLREPGREDKETVESGTAAALKGGVTSVLAMPNTDPAMDSPANIGILKTIAEKTAKANVYICGAITVAREGKKVAPVAGLKKAGAVAISDDGSSVDSDAVFLEALKKAKESGILVICHSEDKRLSGDGVMNLGYTSTRLGLKGISRESEYKRVERDIRLGEKSGSPVHIAHVSCRESVELIGAARKRKIKVTAETCPHYFSLNEEALCGYDTNFKMNPPLRSAEDVAAVREGLKNGILQVIASDHAPHTENEKDIEFDRAAFGVVGLETGLAVSITELLNTGILDWPGLVRALSLNPARILGIEGGTLGEGRIADIAIVNAGAKWKVTKSGLISKSKNSPFLGKELFGLVEYTILGGRVVYRNEIPGYPGTG